MHIQSKKYAIYTAMVGGYDEIMQPMVVDDRFDYILFSNDIKEDRVGVWQVRPIAYNNPDNTRICRYVKTHPEELLQGYEFSIWMDANIQICSSYLYQRAFELYEQDVLISSMWHPARTCIYEEAFAVVNMMVEHEDVVIRWCHQLRKEGFPRRQGLCETNVMFRKHHTCLTAETNVMWWQCIEKQSRRDQLSFNYVLWKLGIPCHYMFGEGVNARNTKHLRLVMHQNIRHNHCPITKTEAWLMRYCWKRKDKTKEIEELYYKLYRYPFPRITFFLAGQWYRLKFLIESYGKYR